MAEKRDQRLNELDEHQAGTTGRLTAKKTGQAIRFQSRDKHRKSKASLNLIKITKITVTNPNFLS